MSAAVSLSPSEGERARVRGVPPPTKKQIARARRHHKKPTWAEKTLWKMLRGEPFAGYKFRRQQPVGECGLDFCCAEALLVVELDGIGQGNEVQGIITFSLVSIPSTHIPPTMLAGRDGDFSRRHLP